MEEAERRRKQEEEDRLNRKVEIEEIYEPTKELFLLMDERFGARLRIPMNIGQF